MKKSLVCITLGLIIGFAIGKEVEGKKEEIKPSISISFETKNTFLQKFINKNDYCFICGEELYTYEHNLCLYCKDWLEGYTEGVKDTIEKYGIIEENL